ncbi:MAG: hypothetical protein ACREOK_13400 [Gemmatimonadaceae bacterium]
MRTRLLTTLVLTSLAIACRESAGPSIGTVAGVYTATTFTSTTSGATINHLAEGSQILILLSTDGSTEGQLLVPGGNDDGSDVNEELTGTWTLSGSTVQFDHAADTFLLDMPFAVSGTRLLGDATIDGTRVQVTLAR